MVKDEAFSDVQCAFLYWKAIFSNFPLLGIMLFLCLPLRNFVIHCQVIVNPTFTVNC